MAGSCNRPLLSPMSGEPGPSCPVSYPRIGEPTPLEQWIINRESGGNPNAHNPHSSAFGIGQLIAANRNALGNALGINPDTTDFDQQLQLMRAYIDARYNGSTQAAINFWQSHGWY